MEDPETGTHGLRRQTGGAIGRSEHSVLYQLKNVVHSGGKRVAVGQQKGSKRLKSSLQNPAQIRLVKYATPDQ
jgi:hypothetical protein